MVLVVVNVYIKKMECSTKLSDLSLLELLILRKFPAHQKICEPQWAQGIYRPWKSVLILFLRIGNHEAPALLQAHSRNCTRSIAKHELLKRGSEPWMDLLADFGFHLTANVSSTEHCLQSQAHIGRQGLQSDESHQSLAFCSEIVFLSVSASHPTNNVVSIHESSPKVKEPEESKMGHDIDIEFNSWMESLETAAGQGSQLQKEIVTIDDSLRHLLFNFIIESGALIVMTFVDRLLTCQHGTQADWDLYKTLSTSLTSAQKREPGLRGRGFKEMNQEVHKYPKV